MASAWTCAAMVAMSFVKDHSTLLEHIYGGNDMPVARLPAEAAAILMASDAADEEVCAANGQVSQEQFLAHKNDPNTTMIPNGRRHHALVAYAGRLRDKGLDYAEAEILFRQRWLLCEQPEGQVSEAKFHSASVSYPVTWVEAQDKLRDVFDRYTPGTKTDGPKLAAAADSRALRITWAKDIEPKPVVWAWKGDLAIGSVDAIDSTDSLAQGNPESMESMGISEASIGGSDGRIPSGTLSISAGPEGVGKSSFGIYMAAKVSTGSLPGSWYGTPHNVLYVAVEDSWNYTLVPRLMAAGADRSRVGRVDAITVTGDEVVLSLPADIKALEAKIIEHDVKWVVLDPLLSLISDRIDSHQERDVRRALDPLAALAERTGAVIQGIAHWNKSGGNDIAYRITGSGAFKNVARSIFGFTRDPDSETGDFVMQQSKNSLGRSDLPSLRYRMEPAKVETPTGMAETGKFIILGESDRTVTDILSSGHKGQPDPDETDEDGYSPAQTFIIEYLLEKAGKYEVPAQDVFDAGKGAGFTQNSLIKARNKVKNEILIHPQRGLVPALDASGNLIPRVRITRRYRRSRTTRSRLGDDKTASATRDLRPARSAKRTRITLPTVALSHDELSTQHPSRRAPIAGRQRVTPATERWQPVIGWEEFYQVSDSHRVRSLDRLVVQKSGRVRRMRGRVLTASRSREDDPPQVTLSGDGRRKCAYVHVLAREAFGKRKG